MRSLLLTVLLGLVAAGGFLYFDQAPKAWADQASLPNLKPTGADTFVFWHSGQQYGVNWQTLEQYAVQGVNWNAAQFTGVAAAGVNWTLPNAYIGG